MNLKSFINFFLRLTARNISFTIVNFVGLTVGFTVVIILTSYLQWEFSYDRFHNQSSSLYRVIRKVDGEGYQGKNRYAITPGPMATEAKLQVQGIESSTRISSLTTLHTNLPNGDAYPLTSLAVDPEFFNMFSWKWLTGKPENFTNDPKAIILTQTAATRLLGELDPIGKSLAIRSFKDLGEFTVQGVIEDFPTNSHITSEIIIQLEPFIAVTQPGDLNEWRNSNYHTYFKLTPGVIPTGVEEAINKIIDTHSEQNEANSSNKSNHILQPINEIHFDQSVAFNFLPPVNRNKLYIILAIACTVMLLACSNYINMAIAQSINRAREIGIRKAVGAQSKNIIVQFLGETTFFCLVSYALAMACTLMLLPYFNQLLGTPLTPADLINTAPILTIILISTILLAAFYPAMVLARYKPTSVLKLRASQPNPKGHSLRDWLVTLQFVVSAILVITITIFQSQLNFMLDKDPGFNREQILNVNLSNAKWREKVDVIREKLNHQSQVSQSSFSNSLPHHVTTRQSREWMTPHGKVDVNFYTLFADENFIELYGLTLITGKNFTKGKQGVHEFIINETAANEYGWEDPVGMEFLEGTDTIRIVGVIKDFHQHSKHLPIAPLRIGHISKGWVSYLSVGFQHDPKPIIELVENTLKEISDDYAIRYSFFDENYAKSYENDQKSNEAILFFTVISIVIASLGLYGLVLFSVNSRTKEIGVRKVLGASWNSISWLMAKHYLKLIVISFIIASIPAYYITHQWLIGFAYHIEIELTHFLIAAGLIFFTVACTMISRLWSTSQINPAEVLRKE